uniref:NAD-specific glutamate dehydrogenase n=1 Tax=Parastrongyloides trichosuri TaxID=131310 RepID=A0A0N4ZEB3_PARTI
MSLLNTPPRVRNSRSLSRASRHLQRDVAVDEVIAHHAAGLQELAVLVQRFQRLVQRGADLRNQLLFFRRQVVQVLVARCARVDLVLDAVQAGHHQRGEGQVAGLDRIREAHFDAACLRVGHPRDAARSRTVAGRVGQHHRCFVARHQALVAVGARVGEGVDGLGVLEDAADVPQRHLAQAAVAVTGEQVGAALGQRLVHVHAAAVVADDRLGHEGDGLAVAVRHVLDDVLHAQQFVGLLHQGAELGADLALAGGGHFVVLHFHFDADLFQGLAHFSAKVVQGVGRRNGEVAALHARTVTAVGAVVLGAAVPCRFFRIDLEEGVAHFIGEADRIEDEEFRLRAEERGFGDARGLQVRLCALGDAARATAIRLHGGRIEDVAADHDGRIGVERVDVGAGGIRQQHHVRFGDALPAGDRAAIEHLAFFKQRRLDDADREGHVLLDTAHVDKTQVDELDLVVLDQLFYVFHGH